MHWWSTDLMARRLNWAKANLAKKPKLSLRDEQEYLDRGFTAHWLERAEKWAALRKKYEQPSSRRNKTARLGRRLSSGRLRPRIVDSTESSG
jgi:hypothetical protein